MSASVTRLPEGAFRLMVFRSMARTLVQELNHAMDGVAARAQAG
jgi:sarcosine oxidase subunit gamma